MSIQLKISIDDEDGTVLVSIPMNAYNGDWIRSARLDPEKDKEKIERLKQTTEVTRISDL